MACVAALLCGCVPQTSPTSTPSVTTSGSSTPTNQTGVDFTAPGAATTVINQLLANVGSKPLLMLEIRRSTAAITVLDNGSARTWAYRDGSIGVVQSDITYESQAAFDVTSFNLTDVGALFRTAAAVSGSSSQQALQIVDYSAGNVMMAVSTSPESRTVFFQPDGTLLPTLDFSTEWGIRHGLVDVIGAQTAVTQVGVTSESDVYIDYPGVNNTTMRRQRLIRFPVSTTSRSDAPKTAVFDPRVVTAAAVMTGYQAFVAAEKVGLTDTWAVKIDGRDPTGTIYMYYVSGSKQFRTDLTGNQA